MSDVFGYSSDSESEEVPKEPKQQKLTAYGGFKMKLTQKRTLGNIYIYSDNLFTLI